ncbi:cell wall binding repeat-containing protein [Clostridium sp. DL-VIII]|uniref:cadherin-like beta sandwich domain-containing protein n=1 Tax=Clostridium sp. DL-VIII TaxID=641107 RepID=UPI00023B06C9|nr:cadherin-like beta sandwich domain-containing protein [Clostridium sp. DL-VIII]EHJ02099.1 cell wall binding repeat-containing protein [Clostridium sp. DL-VIII]
MRVKNVNLKRIFSYLLILTVFFTTVQFGSISKAGAVTTDDKSQIPGLNLYVGDTSSDPKVIDGNAQDGYVCEPLEIGSSFILQADTANGYTITGVSSSNPKKMIITPQGAGKSYSVGSITDYSDFIITVTMKKDNVTTDYKIKMKFNVDSVLQFKNLQVSFDGGQPISVSYADAVSGDATLGPVDSTVKTATIQMLDDSNTPLVFSANGGGSSTQAKINLVGGSNVINITRTYSNVSKQYTLTINKKGVAKLQALAPSTGSLSPAFNSDTYDYALTVATTATSIAFTPTAVDNSSTIKVDGSTVQSGHKSKDIKLDEGENEIDIVVTTKDGDISTYTITVTRTEQFRSANLTGLSLTSGSLLPGFNKGIYQYTATVDNSITSIGVKPVAEDPNATITVNGKEVPSGATSQYISLDEGGNVINVKVTDTKGNSNTYVLNVTRRYSKDNVNLDDLSVTDGTMSPKFDPETYLYSVKVDRSIERVRVLYTTQNDKAKVTINGKEYTNGQSDYINIDIGANLVVVEVTAEDGKTTTTYKLSIIRGDIEGHNDWVLVSGEWTFYDAAGVQVKNEWVKYDNQWYFLDINGYMQTGWLNESGKWYYLNSAGIMQTGWFYDKGFWYYLEANGAMKTNVWATYDGKWYFFNNFGEMQTGWTLYLGKWYYLDDHGIMQKGWITWNKNKYYINDDGTMRTGWLYSGKVWYYLDSSGQMMRGWQTIDGKKYYFDANGAMKTGMMFLDGQWINLNNI